MGVFRLNPFAMHNADSREASSFSAGPLEEEGKLYEFQLAVEEERLDSTELSRLSPEVENFGWEHNCTPQSIMGTPSSSGRSLYSWDCPGQSLDVGFYPSPIESSLSPDPENPDLLEQGILYFPTTHATLYLTVFCPALRYTTNIPFFRAPALHWSERPICFHNLALHHTYAKPLLFLGRRSGLVWN